MIQIIFKNLKRSELVRAAVIRRLKSVVDRFPALKGCRIHATLEMHNSPIQARPDLFTVKVLVRNGRYRGVKLKKSAQNLYVALADVVEHTLEKFNRFGDRLRVKERSRERQKKVCRLGQEPWSFEESI
jgi:ribosome-associated translation inhibitor RaiA